MSLAAHRLLEPFAKAFAVPVLALSRWPQNFGALAAGRDNNLNLLRMIAASMVLFSHSYVLTGRIDQEPLTLLSGHRTDVARLGVVMFFGISGFLIAQSLTRARSLYAFSVARVLRIMPGLIASTLFCAVVIGWAATSLPTSEYWRSEETWRFLVRTVGLSLDVQPGLPGVFPSNPFPVGVNGSLWTIPVEVWCYIAIAVVLGFGIGRRDYLFTVFALCVFIAYALAPDALKPLLPMDARMTTPQLVGTFLFGSWIFINRNRIPCSIGLAVAAFVVFVFSIETWVFDYACFGCTAYITLVLAYHPRVRVRPYLKLGDYSYGLYLLAFPVQQFIVWKYGAMQPVALFALAFCATLALAVLSWHFIEKPSLALKSRLCSSQRWELRLGGTAAKL